MWIERGRKREGRKKRVAYSVWWHALKGDKSRRPVSEPTWVRKVWVIIFEMEWTTVATWLDTGSKRRERIKGITSNFLRKHLLSFTIGGRRRTDLGWDCWVPVWICEDLRDHGNIQVRIHLQVGIWIKVGSGPKR